MDTRNYSDQTDPDQGFEFISAKVLLTREYPPVEWLVDDMLPLVGLSIMSARPKVGKSTLARCLAVSVLQGRKWLDREVMQGGVLYVSMEETESKLSVYFENLGLKVDDDLHLHAGPSPDEGIAALTKHIENYKPAIVIVDPVIDLLKVTDINEYASVSRALAPFLKIAWSSKTHVCLIHHNNKNGGSQGREILGSTALLGRPDCAIVLDEDDKHRRSMYTRQRSGVDLEKTELHLNTDGWVTIGRTVSAAKSDELGLEILDYLRAASSPVDADTIRDAVGKSNAKVLAALKSMTQAGKLTRTGKGSSGSPHKYESIKVPRH